jgi:hypothetical protein
MQYLLLGNGKLNAHLLAAIILGTCILPEYAKIYIKAYKKGQNMRTFITGISKNCCGRTLNM